MIYAAHHHSPIYADLSHMQMISVVVSALEPTPCSSSLIRKLFHRESRRLWSMHVLVKKHSNGELGWSLKSGYFCCQALSWNLSCPKPCFFLYFKLTRTWKQFSGEDVYGHFIFHVFQVNQVFLWSLTSFHLVESQSKTFTLWSTRASLDVQHLNFFFLITSAALFCTLEPSGCFTVPSPTSFFFGGCEVDGLAAAPPAAPEALACSSFGLSAPSGGVRTRCS